MEKSILSGDENNLEVRVIAHLTMCVSVCF